MMLMVLKSGLEKFDYSNPKLLLIFVDSIHIENLNTH